MDANERLWFDHVVEAIFVKGLGARLTPELKKAVLAQGIDLDRLRPAYPVETVARACRVALPLLYPGASEEDGLRALGASSMQGYNETLLGRAAVKLLSLMGVRRALQRLNISMRSGNNYLDTQFKAVGETSAELTLSDVSGMPTFYQGLFEEGGRMIGARRMKVSPAQRREKGFTYLVEWEA